MKSIFAEFDVVHSYTRADAIKDSVLVPIDSDISSQLFKYPVAVTSAVYGIIEKSVSSKSHCNDREGIIWDILWMSQRGITKKIDESEHLFQVIITGTGNEKFHTFKITCHPGDQGEPVLTIMLPHED